MPYPTFTHADLSPLVFSRGEVFPQEHLYVPNQLVGYSQARVARVATLAPEDELFPLVFERLPVADLDLLIAWFQAPQINWSASPFTYTDVASISTLVRYEAGPFRRTQTAYGLCSLTLTLRKEPS